MTKICSSCKKELPLNKFCKDAQRKDGMHPQCKYCRKEYDGKYYLENKEEILKYNKEYYEKHPEKRKQDSRKRRLKSYGLSFDDYDKMLIAQNNVCAICKNPSNGRKLVVDHNHSTDVVRGLLCDYCNLALGPLKEDPIRIKTLLIYLESYNVHAI